MSKDYQEQEKILLKFSGEPEEYKATRVGNNAAWVCSCKHQMPLIWSEFNARMNKQIYTICGNCGRKYEGEGKPDKITEV